MCISPNRIDQSLFSQKKHGLFYKHTVILSSQQVASFALLYIYINLGLFMSLHYIQVKVWKNYVLG